MSTFIFSLSILTALVFNALVMYVLAWLLTEKINMGIKVNPFTCRECMAFWLTLIGGVVIAFWLVKRGTVLPSIKAQQLARLITVYAASFLGLINYLYIKTKFKIYE